MQAEILFPILISAIVSFALFAKNRVDFWEREVAKSHETPRKRVKCGKR